MEAGTAPAPPSAPGRILATVTAAQMLSVAASSIAAVALPSIGRDLGANSTEQQWIIDAFVLVFASLLIAGGAMGDRWGRRTALVTGLAMFAGGSLWCAVAPNVPLLLVGRVIQAFGPALVLPASLAIVSATFTEPSARARATGLWGAGSGIGIMMGPLVGGLLVDTVGWRGVFAVNVPICLLLIATSRRQLVPDRPPVRERRPVDAIGTLMLSAAVALLVFAVIEGRELGWDSAAVLGAGVSAVLLTAGFVRHERAHPAPLIDPGLLLHRGFLAANLGAIALYGSMTGLAVYFSVFFQQIQGRSAFEAGLCLLPNGLAIALFAPLAGALTARYGPRLPMLIGIFTTAGGLVLLVVQLEARTSVAGMWWCFALMGAGMGIGLPSMTVSAVSAVADSRAGMAGAMHNTARQMGQTFAVAILGTIILARAGDDADRVTFTAAAAASWVAGLHLALLASAGALLAAGLAIAFLIPRGPWAFSDTNPQQPDPGNTSSEPVTRGLEVV
jgi:DHA2 family methylenomycin A resistance protein-like MFS transporter